MENMILEIYQRLFARHMTVLWVLAALLSYTHLQAQRTQEELQAQLIAILDRMDKADDNNKYQQLYKGVEELEAALEYNSSILFSIPTANNKASYERALVLKALENSYVLEQYKTLINLLKFRLGKATGKKDYSLALYKDICKKSGCFRMCLKGYSALLDMHSYKPDYRLGRLMNAYWYICQALELPYDVVQDPVMERLMNLAQGGDFSLSGIKEARQKVWNKLQTVDENQINTTFYTQRLKAEWSDDLVPIAEVSHQLGFPRGTFTKGIRLFYQKQYAEALPLFEEAHRKGYDRGTLAYALTLWVLEEDKPQTRRKVYELLKPMTENRYFNTMGALPWANLLEKGDCMPADTAQALDYYMKAYEWGLLSSIKETGYNRQRKLLDIYESGNVEEVTEGNYASMADYYADLKDSVNLLKVLKKGIAEGNADCMVLLGEHYFKGDVLHTDYQLSAMYTQKALDKNPDHPVALCNMAYSLTVGKGIMPDLDKAQQLATRSAKILPNDEKCQALVKYIRKANASKELRNLGVSWTKKNSMDYTKAFYYYERSARKGDLTSLFWMANYYYKGWGGKTPNPAKAVELLCEALPYPPANKMLKEIREKGEKEQEGKPQK